MLDTPVSRRQVGFTSPQKDSSLNIHPTMWSAKGHNLKFENPVEGRKVITEMTADLLTWYMDFAAIMPAGKL
jgi:hypothetical protein